MNEQELKALASKYDLPTDFVSQLWENVTDKENFEKALRMFVAGTLKYEDATSGKPICIADIRRDVAKNFRGLREAMHKRMERERAIADYYAGFKCVRFPLEYNKRPEECVFIKDGVIVAFAHFDPKQGGIYAANNELMPNFNWHPHEHLARIRKQYRVFYRMVKKKADHSPREWFDFSETTVRK